MERGAKPVNVLIKQRRRALDLTQEELAECVGCSTVTIQKIELGERRPSKQIANRLAECLRLPPGEQEAFVRYARAARDDGQQYDPAEFSGDGEAELPASDSAPTSSASVRNNLPSPLTPLIGREAAVATARDYLLRPATRLLTFTGPPGIGKTRLSLQVAADVLVQFSDGVFFVELAPISDPSLVASSIAATLGLTETGSQPILEVIRQFLIKKRALLVLDNFEQVLDAAPLAIELLSTCPALKVLVTSREALHVPGEQQLPVSPLELPDMSHLPHVGELAECSAVALFLERARAVDPDFRLAKANAEEVAAICTRLEGLPLAIELAAAHVKLLSPTQMLARLNDQLRLLARPTAARAAHSEHLRHLPARQQTMRGAIEWSYRLLETEEQQLLARLGVFVGGWTLEAAEELCGSDAISGIESLLEKSLLKREQSTDEEKEQRKERERRFTMLESIREYALERLRSSGEEEDVQRKHALYFLDLAERAEPHLRAEEQTVWFKRLEQEHSNVRAAMSWALAHREEDMILRFGGTLLRFWENRYPSEGRWWLEGAIKGGALKPSITLMHARAFLCAAHVLRKTREYPQARALFEETLRIYRALDDRQGMANSLRWMATVMFSMNLPGDRELAKETFEESLRLFEETGDARGVAHVLVSQGEAAREERDYTHAIEAYERGLVIFRELKDKNPLATCEANLAYVLYHRGDYEQAKTLLRESLGIYRDMASAYSVGWALFAWAGITKAQGAACKAARLAGAASALVAPGGAPFDPPDQQDREEIEASIRAALSDEEWQRAQEEGRAMSIDEAIEYALDHTQEGTTASELR